MSYSEFSPLLLGVARQSIQYGLEHGRAPRLVEQDFPPPLWENRATFVTLKINGDLRGCIGTLEAHRPLACDVADNAFAAAFRDPRFQRLSDKEFPLLHYHISVLTPPEPMAFTDEKDLLGKLRPGVDGLVLQAGPYRGTFLPAVWESLPDPEQFLHHLKLKAGLPPDYGPEQFKVMRYTVEDIESAAPDTVAN
jgi:AmmeMemoRadiSam system protein A